MAQATDLQTTFLTDSTKPSASPENHNFEQSFIISAESYELLSSRSNLVRLATKYNNNKPWFTYYLPKKAPFIFFTLYRVLVWLSQEYPEDTLQDIHLPNLFDVAMYLDSEYLVYYIIEQLTTAFQIPCILVHMNTYFPPTHIWLNTLIMGLVKHQNVTKSSIHRILRHPDQGHQFRILHRILKQGRLNMTKISPWSKYIACSLCHSLIESDQIKFNLLTLFRPTPCCGQICHSDCLSEFKTIPNTKCKTCHCPLQHGIVSYELERQSGIDLRTLIQAFRIS